jgi:predicted transcriptional regulator YdeE
MQIAYTKGMYESPIHQVISKAGPFSIRQYQPFKTVSASRSHIKGYGSFNDLFGYISGHNKEKTSMKMTVPVINDVETSGMTMEFVIPKLHQDHTPLPQSPLLNIKEYPSSLFAVYRFRGNVTEEMIKTYQTLLTDWIITKGYTPQGALKIARYNPPFTPGFLKRNELWLSIKPST